MSDLAWPLLKTFVKIKNMQNTIGGENNKK